MKKPTIYTTDSCGYCTAAKKLLDKHGIQYEEINLTRDPAGRAGLAEKTGNYTFPQIVVDDELIGGFKELKALEVQDKLDVTFD